MGREGKEILGTAGMMGTERLDLWPGSLGIGFCRRGKPGVTAEEGVVG